MAGRAVSRGSVWGLAVLAASALSVGVAFGMSGRPGAAPAGGLRPSARVERRAVSANQAVALRDVRRLVGRVRLVRGAVRVRSRPAGDHGYLVPLSMLVGDQAHAVIHQWWKLRSSPRSVISYVEAHPPAGGRRSITATLGNARTGTSALMVTFQWPTIKRVLGYRAVAITATRLRDGLTGVLVEGQSDWIVERLRSERIPAGVSRILITSGVPGHSRRLSFHISRTRTVRQIVTVINRLRVTQPTDVSCPMMSRPRLITMRFSSVNRTQLAVLRYDDFWPWSAPATECKSVQLTIAGKSQPSLIGGEFLRTVGRLIGHALT